MNIIKCSYCGGKITGARCVDDKGDYCHRHCFHRNNKPKEANNLFEIVRGDTAIAAQVITEYVRPDIAKCIVSVYNRRIMERWERLCKSDKE